VVGPERITRSTVAPGSDESSLSRSSPSTTRSLFTTTQASQPAARTRSHALSTFSAGAQVGTSRRAVSPMVGTEASLPSLGSPLANQSALPGT
jgi:hypothetical protein